MAGCEVALLQSDAFLAGTTMPLVVCVVVVDADGKRTRAVPIFGSEASAKYLGLPRERTGSVCRGRVQVPF